MIRRAKMSIALVLCALSGVVTAGEEPFSCADENAWCHLPRSHDYYSMSYGTEARSIFVTTSNVAAVPCSNDLGDPHGGTVKKCLAVEIRSKPKETFTRCADEGKICNITVTSGQYRVARYGTPTGNRWIYNNIASSFGCDNGAFGFRVDPAPGIRKVCEVSTQPLGMPDSRWVPCGTEGQECKLNSASGTYLIRYGAGNGWAFRTFVGGALACNNRTFGYDPAVNQPKACSYRQMPTVHEVSGQWEKVTQCDGCKAGQFKASWGVEQGNTREKASSWSQEVKVSVEAGFTIKGVGGTATTESTTTFGGSSAVVDSFTQSKGGEITYECEKGAFWQFVTTVDEFCRPNSKSCSTVARAQIFKCTVLGDQPNATWLTHSPRTGG